MAPTPWNEWICPKCGVGIANLPNEYKATHPQLKWDENVHRLMIQCLVCGFSAAVGPTT